MTARYASHSEILDELAIGPQTLRAMMADGEEAGIRRPWVDVGSSRRPCYRWRIDQVDRWVEEVSEWRRSTRRKAARAGSSAGERAARTAPDGAPTDAPPSASRPRSTGRRPRANGGKLKQIARTATSTK